MNKYEISITLPLHSYLDDLWKSSDKKDVPKVFAEVIALQDPNELCCHVQFEDAKGNKLARPNIWRVDDWKQCAERIMYLREKSERERQEKYAKEATEAEYAKVIAADTGLPLTLARMLAISVMEMKDPDERAAALKNFNLKENNNVTPVNQT
ncbi:MAG TPA: hypothetical protein VL854_11930 [Nitrososphaeraceae archaeon]|nr:hypothetical protein [Nitrososphaeraceae archaeon]